VPEIDGRIGDRFTGIDIDDGYAQLEGETGFILNEVGTQQFAGDIERADLLLGDQCACRNRGAGEGTRREVEGRCGGDTGSNESASGDSVLNWMPHFL